MIIAAPILRVAESRFKDTRVQHHHKGVYFPISGIVRQRNFFLAKPFPQA